MTKNERERKKDDFKWQSEDSSSSSEGPGRKRGKRKLQRVVSKTRNHLAKGGRGREVSSRAFLVLRQFPHLPQERASQYIDMYAMVWYYGKHRVRIFLLYLVFLLWEYFNFRDWWGVSHFVHKGLSRRLRGEKPGCWHERSLCIFTGYSKDDIRDVSEKANFFDGIY